MASAGAGAAVARDKSKAVMWSDGRMRSPRPRELQREISRYFQKQQELEIERLEMENEAMKWTTETKMISRASASRS